MTAVGTPLQPPAAATTSPWYRRHGVVLMAVALAGAVFAASLLWHPRLLPTGESDQYLQMAEATLRGEVRDDPFHPLLYAQAVAAAGWVCGDCFVGGKLVTAASLGLLFLALRRLLAARLPPRVATFGAFALAVDPRVLSLGMQVASDLPGTALVLAAWAAATTGRRSLGLAGLCAGLAAATRYNLGLHGLLLGVVALCAGRPGRLRRAGVVAGGVALGLLPHVVQRVGWGLPPFSAVNWKNIVMKYAYGYDLHAVTHVPDERLAAQLREHAGEWAVQGLGDGVGWCRGGLTEHLLGAHAAGLPWIPTTVLGLLAVAAVLALVRRHPVGVALAVVVVVHGFAVALAFHPLYRVMLPATLAAGALGLAFPPVPARLRGAVASGLAVAIAVAAVGDAAREIEAFRAGHCDAEVAAARELVAARGPLVQLAGTYPFLDRDVVCAGCSYVPSFGARTDVDAAALWLRLAEPVPQRPVSHFVIGRQSARVMYDLAGRVDLPAGWRRLRSDADVVVLERLPETPPELEVPAGPWSGGALPLRVSWRGDAGDVVWAGVALRGPGGAELRVPFARGEGGFVGELPAGALGRGEWRCVPAVLRRDGAIEQGEERRLVVE